MENVRIQKVLAEAGIASRRAVEQMILDGRITVNGRLVLQIPCFVDPLHDDIRLDNQPIRKRASQHVYLLLNKPRGVVCDSRDASGRPRVFDMVRGLGGGAFCAAPLDMDSTGLVILTNDGGFHQMLAHPRYSLEKAYVVEVDGSPHPDAMARLKEGLFLDGRRTNPAKFKILHRSPGQTLMEVKIAETHNRELRRLFALLGHKVRRMKRTAIGTITDRGVKIGHLRPLRAAEVEGLLGQIRETRPPRFGRSASRRAGASAARGTRRSRRIFGRNERE